MRHVKRHLIEEGQQAGNLIGGRLGGMEVPVIEQRVDAAGGGVTQIELGRADGAALQSDAEHLALHRVDDVLFVVLDRIDFIEAVFQAQPRRKPVGRGVLESVGNPQVVETRAALLLADVRGDTAAGLDVIDPEAARFFVGMRQGQSVEHRVREHRRVEVEHDAALARPVEPGVEVLGFQLVALHLFAAGHGVDRVQRQPFFAGNHAVRLVEIGGQLLEAAGFAGIIAGRLNAAGKIAAVEKALDVVALPAMHGNGDRLKSGDRRIDVHAERGVFLYCVHKSTSLL